MKSDFFDTFKPLAGGMRPLEIVEYSLLALMTVLLPYDWQLAMWLMPLLAVNTLCRIVAARRVGNPGLTGASRWALWLMVAFCVVAFLEVVAVGVGLILNASIGGELGHTIIHYAVLIGGVFAALWLGFMLFFA